MAVHALPKLVTTLALFGLLAACHGKIQEKSPVVAGAGSEVGQALTAKEWCGDTRVEDNHFVTDHFTFRPQGELTLISTQLQTDGSVKPVANSSGTWALLNDDLYMMHGQETLRSRIAAKVRASDKANCLTMTSDDATVLLCTCQN